MLAGRFDVVHLHSGLDATEPEPQVLLQALKRRSTPLVLTIHRLDDLVRLDLLVPAAAAVVVLSSEAGEQVRARWGRDALVVPHPHVVPLHVVQQAGSMRDVRRRGGRALVFRVGLLVGADADAGLGPALADTVHAMSGTLLPIDARADLLHDESLWSHLALLDALVLAPGSSGAATWLEACRDLGTAVVAPDGALPPSAPVLTYRCDDGRLDVESLGAAIHEVYSGHAPQPPGTELRRQQRSAAAEVHARLYREVCARGARASRRDRGPATTDERTP